MKLRHYHVILSVTDKGQILDHLPLRQYWQVRYEIGSRKIDRVTLTLPVVDNGKVEMSSVPIDIELYLKTRGFSSHTIKDWLKDRGWTKTKTLLLFNVSFEKGHLDYKLVGKVDTKVL